MNTEAQVMRRGRPPNQEGRLARRWHQDTDEGWELLRRLAEGRGCSPPALLRALVREEARRVGRVRHE